MRYNCVGDNYNCVIACSESKSEMRAEWIICGMCAIRMCEGKMEKWDAAATAAGMEWNENREEQNEHNAVGKMDGVSSN